MCNPVEIMIGAFGQIDVNKYGAEPMITGKFSIPLELVAPGNPYQMTRGQLAEQLMLALESGLADFQQYINQLRSQVDLEPTQLKFDYKHHQVNYEHR